MSCTVCGSTTSCQCSTTCNSGASCCPTSIPASPLPYYACAPACPESHSQRLVLQQFYSTISIQNSWNVPDCGEQATLVSVGLKSANPGSYIWNSEYGYFEIVSFDASTGQLVIQNNCNEGNAAAGTNVPACTEFNVTVPPCECPEDNEICVAIDFTAPAVGNCVDITLTTTQGLTASDTVQIGSGFYFLDAIKPNNVVTICNTGQGIAAGTPVIAVDANGNYQYCLGIISTNPCDRDVVPEVQLLGCDGDDVTAPLDCATIGWVPTAISGSGDEVAVACRPLGTTSECSFLTAALSLTSGDATYANVAVDDSTAFTVGDIVEFAGGNWTAEITGIPDGTHIDITLSPTPSFNTSIADETLFCLQNCCDALQSEIENLEDTLFGASDFIRDDDSHTVLDGDATYSAPTDSFTIVNPSPDLSLDVHLIFTGYCAAMHQAAGEAYVQGRLDLYYNFDAGPNLGANTIVITYHNDVDVDLNVTYETSDHRVITIPPATSVNVVTGVIINWLGDTPPPATSITTSVLEVRWSYLAVGHP